MNLESNASKPIFMQISDFIEDAILSDELLVDEQAFSTNQLSKLFTINPATARKGLSILVEQEILYKKRGVGMFVSGNAKEIILAKRTSVFYDQYIKKMFSEAKKLGLKKNDIIAFIDKSDWRD